MPETFGLEYLIEHMLTIGPGLSGAMGMVPLDFNEIRAWCECSSVPLTGFECTTIRDLSRAYVGQMSVSSKTDCPAPWVKGVEDMEAYNLSNALSSIPEAEKPKTLSRRSLKR